MHNLAQNNWDYYKGDTWQFWTGPKPPTNHPKYSEVMTRLKAVFHSYNVVKEVVNHYANALIGKPFNWYLSTDGQPLPDNNQAEEVLQKWYDWNRQLALSTTYKPLTEAVRQMLVCDNGEGIGIGYLRLYTPKRFQNNPDPYKKIIFHCPIPGSVTIKRDSDNFPYYATYNHQNGTETYELLDSGKTRLTLADGTIQEADLGDQVPIFELRGECLLTNALKQSQNSINKTLTLKDENINFAGFLERVITNGQLPGRWEKDPESADGERFVPDANAMQFGANSIAWVSGMPIGDPKNPSGYTTPQMNYRQPVDVSTFEHGLNIDRTCAYMEAGLGHLLTTGDGNLSGVSRETIKQDYETRLTDYGQTISTVVASLFSTAAILLNPQWRDYSPVIELNLATGEPNPEERRENREDYAAGLISRTTAMVRGGVSDPDSEVLLLRREREDELKYLATQNPGLDQLLPDG